MKNLLKKIKIIRFKLQAFLVIILIISALATSSPTTFVLAQEATSSAQIQEATPSAIIPSQITTPIPQLTVTDSPTLGSASGTVTPNPTLTPLPTSLPLLSTPSATITQVPQPTLTDTPTPMASASIRQPLRVRPLGKKHFSANESVDIAVFNAQNENFTAILLDAGGEEVTAQIEKTILNNDVELHIKPPQNFRPGKYTLKIIGDKGSIQTEDFVWGVLAINTNKSIYAPHETAQLAMAVLDEQGRMVCDAKVSLIITDPDGKKTELSTLKGTIVINRECSIHDVTEKPDYQAHYETTGIGKYIMNLSAQTDNGVFTITDAFEVRSSVPFDVERISATRIYPPAKYPVVFKIVAHEDFTGTVEERVPIDFVTSAPSGNAQPYDSVRIASGAAVLSQSHEASLINLRMPFDGKFAKSLGFDEPVDDPQIAKQYARYGLRGHDGLDFAMPDGTPVLAVDDGEVVLAGDGAYGQTIVLQHSWGKSYYGHLSYINIKLSQKVLKGDVIGKSGHSGLATAPHLHFGMKLNRFNPSNGFYGKIDPSPYLGGTSVISSSAVKILSWNVSVKKGDTFTLGYNFKAPTNSPQFYLLGPLTFRLAVVPSSLPAMDNNPFVLGTATSAGSLSPISVASGSGTNSQPGTSVEVSQKTADPIALPGPLVFQETRLWQIAADAAIALRAAQGSNNAGATTIVMTVPTGVVDGDVMMMFITYRGGTNVFGLTGATGWTSVSGANSTSVLGQNLWWRVASSEPASYTITFKDEFNQPISEKASGVIIALSGADTTALVAAQYGGQVNASSATGTAPALGTWASVNGMDLFFGGTAVGTTATPPTNYTEPANGEAASTGGAASSRTTSEVAYRALTAVTSTPSISNTFAAAAVNIGHHAFIKEAAQSSTPTLDQLMRHGAWFSSGVEQPFTF